MMSNFLLMALVSSNAINIHSFWEARVVVLLDLVVLNVIVCYMVLSSVALLSGLHMTKSLQIRSCSNFNVTSLKLAENDRKCWQPQEIVSYNVHAFM